MAVIAEANLVNEEVQNVEMVATREKKQSTGRMSQQSVCSRRNTMRTEKKKQNRKIKARVSAAAATTVIATMTTTIFLATTKIDITIIQ